MDPEVQAIVDQLGGATIMDIAMGTAPQTGLLGAALWGAWKRVREAEEKLDAILTLSQELMKLHEDDDSKFSTVHIAKILETMVTKDKSQHAHNSWVQRALLKIVRRGSGHPEADELDLTQPKPPE